MNVANKEKLLDIEYELKSIQEDIGAAKMGYTLKPGETETTKVERLVERIVAQVQALVDVMGSTEKTNDISNITPA